MWKIAILLFTTLYTLDFSFGQEWLLGKEKRDVVNQYKCECHVTSIRDTIITFNCTQKGFQQRAFTFGGDTCIKTWWATDIESKNQFMERYISLNYNIHSYEKTLHNLQARITEFTNDKYAITIITYPYSHFDSAFIISNYIK